MSKLREFRIKSNLTMREVALQLEISESSVCLHESGDRQPSIRVIKKYAKIYKCNISDLID